MHPAGDSFQWTVPDKAPLVFAITIAGSLLMPWLTRDRRPMTVCFVVFVVGVMWLAMGEALTSRGLGAAFGASGVSEALIAGWSIVLFVFVVAHGWMRRRAMWRLAASDPDALLRPVEEWPGFRKAAGGVSVLLILLVCYELASAGRSVDGAWTMLMFASSGVAGATTFSLLRQRWSANLAEVAMGLVTLSVVCLFLPVIPDQPDDPAARFPMMFNALMIGFALMAGFWIWIGKVWEQQVDGDVAWTAAGRISRLTAGFAFLVALLALVNGSLMAVWPRLKPVGVFDDSLGRMSAAVTGHLWLLLVVLWSRRRTKRTAFDALALLVGLSLVGFIAIRVGPLAARVHEGATMDARVDLVDGAHA